MKNAGLDLPREFLGLNLFEIFSVTILVLKKNPFITLGTYSSMFVGFSQTL